MLLLVAVKYKTDSPLVVIISSVIAVVLSTIFGLVIVTFIVHRYIDSILLAEVGALFAVYRFISISGYR